MKMSRYLLFLSVFSIPFYRLYTVLGVRITTTELLFSIAFCIWVVERLFPENKIERTQLFFPIMLFLGAYVLSSTVAVNKFIAFRETVQFVWLFGMYFFIFNVAKGRKGNNIILFFCILAGVITSAVGLYKCFHVAGSLWDYRVNIASTFENQPNALGSYLIGIIPLSFALFIGNKRKWKYAIISSSFIMMLALFATFSRGSWIGLLCGIGIMIIIFSRQQIKKYFSFLIIALLFLGITVIYILTNPKLYGLIPGEAQSLFSRSISDTERTILAKSAFYMTRDYPVSGVGPGNYILLLPRYADAADLPSKEIEIPHNMFLQVSAETGLIGLAAFLWLLYAYYKASLKLVLTSSNGEERVIRAGLIGSATAVLASGIFGWPFSHGVQEILILSMALSTADWGTDGS